MTNEIPEDHQPPPTGAYQSFPVPNEYVIVINSKGDNFEVCPDPRLDPNAVLRDLLDALTQFMPTVCKYNEKRPIQVKEYIIEQIKKA